MYPPGSGFHEEEGKSRRGAGGAGSCAASPSTKAMGTIFCPYNRGTGGGICAGPRGSALLGDGDQPSGAALGAAEAAEPAEGSLSRSPSRVATPFFSKPDVKLMKSRRNGWLWTIFLPPAAIFAPQKNRCISCSDNLRYLSVFIRQKFELLGVSVLAPFLRGSQNPENPSRLLGTTRGVDPLEDPRLGDDSPATGKQASDCACLGTCVVSRSSSLAWSPASELTYFQEKGSKIGVVLIHYTPKKSDMTQ